MPPMPPKMPPAMPPKQPFVEKIQWIILIGGFVSLYIIVLFQNMQMQNLADRITRATESNDYAVGVIERRLLQNGVPELTQRATETPSSTAAPQSIDIPGSRVTLVIPGEWKVTPRGNVVNISNDADSLTVQASTDQIVGDDLQAWFKKFLPTGKNSRVTVGPNQILLGGKLAIDATVETEVVDWDFGGTQPRPVIERFTAVRDGGTMTVFRARSQTGDVAGAQQAWDAALKTLTFGI